MQFAGQEAFPQGLTTIAARLGDAGWLAGNLPEAEIIELAQDRASWKVRPKLAFISGNLDTTAEVLSRTDYLIQYRITSRSVGVLSTIVAHLHLNEDTSGGTLVNWTGELTELGGLLRMLPQPMLQTAVERVIADVWRAIRVKI